MPGARGRELTRGTIAAFHYPQKSADRYRQALYRGEFCAIPGASAEANRWVTLRKSIWADETFGGSRIMTRYAGVLALVRQFVNFTGVGFVSAIGHYGLLIALVQIAGVPPVPASAAGALLGAWINYMLNYHFTFRSGKRHREAALKFAAVATVGLVLNTVFMWVGIELIGAHYLLSQIVTTGLVLIWSFAGNRYWTFQQ